MENCIVVPTSQNTGTVLVGNYCQCLNCDFTFGAKNALLDTVPRNVPEVRDHKRYTTSIFAFFFSFSYCAFHADSELQRQQTFFTTVSHNYGHNRLTTKIQKPTK